MPRHYWNKASYTGINSTELEARQRGREEEKEMDR